MTISKTDADAFIKAFDSISPLIADALDLTPTTGLKSAESLDKLYVSLLSASNSSGAIEPYTFAQIVTSLQVAISQRHIHRKA